MRRNARPVSAPEKLRRNARSYLAVYLRRGKVSEGLCAICRAAEDLVAHQVNPRSPLFLVWYCRLHYRDVLREEALEEAKLSFRAGGGFRIADQPAEDEADLAAEFNAMSESDRADVLRQARHGPRGMQLDKNSPLFRMNVLSVLRKRRQVSTI